jgi:hypothetical protein
MPKNHEEDEDYCEDDEIVEPTIENMKRLLGPLWEELRGKVPENFADIYITVIGILRPEEKEVLKKQLREIGWLSKFAILCNFTDSLAAAPVEIPRKPKKE